LMLPANLFLGVVLFESISEYNYAKSNYELEIKSVANEFAKSMKEELQDEYVEFLVSEELRLDKIDKLQNSIRNFNGDEILQMVDQIQQVNYQNQVLYQELMLLREGK